MLHARLQTPCSVQVREHCERFICLKHHVKYRSGYHSYDYCPPCADRTRCLLFLLLAVSIVVLAAGGLVIYLTTR